MQCCATEKLPSHESNEREEKNFQGNSRFQFNRFASDLVLISAPSVSESCCEDWHRNEWASTIFNFLSISSPCCIAKSSRWARTRKTTINAEERQTCSSGWGKVFRNLVKYFVSSPTIIGIKFQVTSPWLWIVPKMLFKVSSLNFKISRWFLIKLFCSF